MLVPGHQIAACLPGADGNHQRPYQAVGQGPGQIAHAVRVQIAEVPGPGDDAGHTLAVGQGGNTAEPAPCRVDDEGHSHKGGCQENQKHDGVRQQYAGGAGVNGEGREGQPHDHRAERIVQPGDAADQRGNPLNGGEQIGADGNNENERGELFQLRRVKSAAEIFRKSACPAAADIAAEKARAVDIAGGLDHAHNDDAHKEARIDFSRIPQKGPGGQEGRDQRAHHQNRGRIAPGHIVVVGAFYPAPCQNPHGKEQNKGGQYAHKIDIHSLPSLSRLRAVRDR